jgi:hypothetical protein
MSDIMSGLPPGSAPHDRLIAELAADLRPVRRLSPPWVRALGWIAAVTALGLGLSQLADFEPVRQRLSAAPDLWLAVVGSTLTAVLAALAAFQTSVPGRGTAWALLPVPAALLWLGASGLGCLRAWLAPGTHAPSLAEERSCLVFIVGVSLPLSLLLMLMLRRAFALRPGLTAALGGLAAAAAAATLLTLFHPYDAAATDLVVHGLAVLAVVIGNRALGERLLDGTRA